MEAVEEASALRCSLSSSPAAAVTVTATTAMGGEAASRRASRLCLGDDAPEEAVGSLSLGKRRREGGQPEEEA